MRRWKGWLRNMRIAVAFAEPYPSADLLLVPGGNLATGAKDFCARYPDATTLELDLLVLSAAVYAADVASRRGDRLAFCRHFALEIPVANYHALNRVRQDIERVLHFLSSDNWDIRFTQRADAPEPPRQWPDIVGMTLLFSGGLDSFAAAVDKLADGVTLQLVSHVTANQVVRSSQEGLLH